MTKGTTLWRAAEVYVDPDLMVRYSNPTRNRQDALELLQQWVEKQGRSWPAALSAVVLARDMQCVHVAYLGVHTVMSFGWSAVVGNTEYWTTTNYDGSKSTHSRETTHRTSGSVVDHVFGNYVVDSSQGAIRCGEPDLLAAEQVASELKGNNDIAMLPAEWRTADGVERRLDQLLTEVAADIARANARRAGSVKSVETSPISCGDKSLWVTLYPVWLSRYTHKERIRAVQVDGHTGRIYVDVPAAVRFKRFVKGALMVGAAILALVAVDMCRIASGPGASGGAAGAGVEAPLGDAGSDSSEPLLPGSVASF